METVDRLEPGDHACLTYSDAEERLDLLAAFVGRGAQLGERVLCFTDDPVGADLRQRGVPAGENVVPIQELWGAGAQPDAAAMVRRLSAERDRSPRGLRVTLDMCWAARPQAGAEQLLAFENEVAELFADGGFTALCEYDREAFDPVTLAYAARTHARTVTAAVYHEDAGLRICRQHVPPGIRVAGALDVSQAGALRDALAEAVRLDPDVHLNLGHLRSLDDGSAAVIVRAAAGLPRNRHMIVVGDRQAGRTLRVAGAHGVPNLRLLVRDR
ncbi:MEDS domain-containing protein [Paractinoplanes lichenicola]|uniref:MEDS domain-containing protein n=1 Tax=Paractinoplanes lichenicola TaxID=2802976 RepID=A0ABS1W1R7_9ACTN|nr:MEDS domain-containing protein [Actinoplanes lichenicola]MBL7260637.1 MEDS domain-containing protein [Actinoplanes lichenicola]